MIGDGAVAAAYPGTDDAPTYTRACDAIDGPFAKGLVVGVGGCGTAEVHRFGDAIVIPEHYTADDDADSEAALDHAIAGHPTTKPKKLGTVTIRDGRLVLTGLTERGPKKLRALAPGKVAATPSGCAIGVRNGRYDVYREQLDIRGAYGTIATRMRIVPAGTKLVAGAPIATAPAPRRAAKSPGAERRLVEWAAIKSLAAATDGRLFAGENGGFRVAAWTSDGSLAWERAIAKPRKGALFAETRIELVGKDLVVMVRDQNEVTALTILDAATSAPRRTLKIPSACAFHVAGDRLVLLTDETAILSYPAAKPIARFIEYTSKLQVAVSPDGRWLATTGDGCHVYDGKRHVRTIDFDPDPYAVAFTDRELVVGDSDGAIHVFDPATGKRRIRIDVARERSRKPTVIAIATSARHLAAARNDGAVAVVDRKTSKVVHVFDGHVAAHESIGSNALDGVAFSADGAMLWVTGARKGQPAGLTGYRVE